MCRVYGNMQACHETRLLRSRWKSSGSAKTLVYSFLASHDNNSLLKKGNMVHDNGLPV